MASPERVTGPLLDVLDVLMQAHDDEAGDLHGWAIMKAAGRSGPTVYGVLDRLEDLGWISGDWEQENPDPSKPRRRLYRITAAGAAGARSLLRERRPGRLSQPSRPAPGTVLPGWPQPARHGRST